MNHELNSMKGEIINYQFKLKELIELRQKTEKAPVNKGNINFEIQAKLEEANVKLEEKEEHLTFTAGANIETPKLTKKVTHEAKKCKQ